MKKYNLKFIDDELIFEHVKQTVLLYKTAIGLSDFNSNLIDPIKLTFDAKIYGKTFDEIVESECIRQIDKANTNHIGYFHQNLFKYAGNGWYVPAQGFDVVNDKKHIYVEMKNKHNTMNSSSAQATYMKMQKKLLEDPQATCMLVEVIAKQSQDIPWKGTLNGVQYSHPNIRRISIDKFYKIVFGKSDAFMLLCKKLPQIIEDVVLETHKQEMMERGTIKERNCNIGMESPADHGIIKSTVSQELKKISSDTFKSLYLLAFETYEGFSRF